MLTLTYKRRNIKCMANTVWKGLALAFGGIAVGLTVRSYQNSSTPRRKLGPLSDDLTAVDERRSTEIMVLGERVSELTQKFTHLESEVSQEIDARLDSRMRHLEERLHQDFSQAHHLALDAFVKAVETKVVQRISALEENLTGQSEAIAGLREKSLRTEENIRNMLAAVQSLSEGIQTANAAPVTAAPASNGTHARRKPSMPLMLVLLAMAVGLWGLFLVAAFQSGTRPQVIVPQKSAAVRPVPAVVVTPTPSPQQRTPVVETARKVLVGVTAGEPTWISIASDGKPAFEGRMQPSQTKTLEASERVSLVVGNAGGVEISLNGKAIGPIGRHGQVRRVELTAESFRIGSGRPGSSNSL